VAISGFVAVAVAGISSWIAGGIAAPLRRLANEVTAISSSTLDHPLSAPTGQLAEIEAVYLAFSDMLQRLAAEAELNRSNAELEQFAYAASHDLRQPLRMVAGYLRMIERHLGDALDVQGREYFKFATDGAKRMDALILALLDYSRVGRGDVHFEPIELATVIRDALVNLEVAIRDASATVVVADLLPTVMADRIELVRVFQNLIGNALKYRHADSPARIQVTSEDFGREWVIRVVDNGIGIASEHHERVFAIFQRLVTHEQYEGTGIGLSLCRKIVEHHGGRIWVESEEGKGSTFFVALPKAPS
jgi:light-regulated signal transduction histidine kinase (bacteriophytochrome)